MKNNIKEIERIVSTLDGENFREFEKTLYKLKFSIKSMKASIIPKVIEAVKKDDFESLKEYKELINLVECFDFNNGKTPDKDSIKELEKIDDRNEEDMVEEDVIKEDEYIVNERFANITKSDEEILESGFEDTTLDSYEKVTLDDNSSNRKPAAVEFLGEVFSVYTWRELTESICLSLSSVNPDLFSSFVRNKTVNGVKNRYFGKTSKDMETAVLIGEGSKAIFVDVAKLTNNNFFFLKKVLRIYGFEPTDVNIYLDTNFIRKKPVYANVKKK